MPDAAKQAEIEAAIAKAEAKGRPDLADKLRAYLPSQVAGQGTGATDTIAVTKFDPKAYMAETGLG